MIPSICVSCPPFMATKWFTVVVLEYQHFDGLADPEREREGEREREIVI